MSEIPPLKKRAVLPRPDANGTPRSTGGTGADPAHADLPTAQRRSIRDVFGEHLRNAVIGGLMGTGVLVPMVAAAQSVERPDPSGHAGLDLSVRGNGAQAVIVKKGFFDLLSGVTVGAMLEAYRGPGVYLDEDIDRQATGRDFDGLAQWLREHAPNASIFFHRRLTSVLQPT